ncbi:MAG: peptidylprolyl isomerase [Microscillaceae bacterium]|jgi:cyclophilin family peptidyl-prolyl cis-trans isomerase|nr:peptidylprolyl isomerase [Microscillaceae bacterium]
MKNLILFITISLSINYAFSQNRFDDRTLKEIYDFQDWRSSNDLVNFLGNPNPMYREAAAFAFASVQDTAAVDYLTALFADNNAQVRKAAAYALGQVGNVRAEPMLIQALANESNTTVKCYLLEALGLCASAKGLDYLTKTNFADDSLNLGVARGLYRAGLKNLRNETATQKIIDLLNSEFIQAKKMASFYVARFANQLKFQGFEYALLRGANFEFFPMIQTNCATALGMLKTKIANDMLKNLAQNAKNYMVRYAALRALSRQDSMKSFFKEALVSQKNVHLGVLISQHLINQLTAEDKTWLNGLLLGEKRLVFPSYWQISANLWTAMAKIDPDKKVNERLINAFQNAQSVYEKGAWLKALAQKPENYGWIAEQIEKTNQSVLQVFGLEALNAIALNPQLKKMPDSLKIKQELAKVYRWAIESIDVGMISTASQVLLDKSLNFKALYKDYGFIRNSLSKIQLPRDVEAYLELQKVLAHFEGKTATEEYPKSEPTPIDWKIVAQIKATQKAEIKTNKGTIVLQLLVNDAPGSVETFYKLAKKGFYDGKTFHRVVSNFVVQGGCPRGDGYGGLDYTIRSEFAPLNYEEGYVGLASAGKDTESCQFFITHWATPHLDGRYTIFAKVIAGMDIVQQIMIGDKIEKISIID